MPDQLARDEKNRFVTGNIGGPGRPKGSRNKLGEAFVTDLLADWQEHGIEAIKLVRAERPSDYLKVVASVIPKEVNVTVNDYDELTDDELAEQFAAVAAQLTRGGEQARFGIGEEAAGKGGKGKPARVH